jgi:hypothetical protein
VFFEPRLGKSKTALDYVGILALKGELRRVVIFGPKIALDVWEGQLHEHFAYAYTAETFTEEWSVNSRPEPHVEFFLAGREETFRAERVQYKTRSGRTRSELVRRKQDEIEAWDPDAIIVDESHEYKRPGGRGAQDAWRLVSRLRLQRRARGAHGPYVLLLSGTPSPRGWRDLFAQFRIMDPTLLGTSVGSFDEQYCVYGQGPRKYTIIRYRNLARLKRILREHSTVCSAAKAGLDGKIFFQSLRVDLPERVRAKYVEMVEDFVTEVDGELLTAKNQGVKRLRLQQVTGGFTTSGREIHREKVEELRGWLNLLRSQGEHVVVGARFSPEVRACGMVAKECGFNTAIIDGSTSSVDRVKAIRAFQTSTKPSALVFQIQAGSRAIELSRAAELVFYSLPDGWVDFWQFLNRVRGPNQKRPVRVSAILARGSVDISGLASLRRKENMHGEMMRSPRRYLLGLIQ